MSAPDDVYRALLDALPGPPDYLYDWAWIEAQPALARLIRAMAETPQEPAFHGEGDVWTHTRMVCEALTGLPGFRESPPERRQALALAALLHDIGKPACTRTENGRLVSPHHGPVGAAMARTVLWTAFGLCGAPAATAFREACCCLIRYHTLPQHLYDQDDPGRRARRIACIGELAPAFSLSALITLGEADALGRVCGDRQALLDDLALSRETAREAGCADAPYPFASAYTKRAYFRGGQVWPDQALYDDSFGEVILMCGLPGVGKDTFIRKRWPELPVVSMDDIRRSQGIRPTDNQGRVAQAAREQARAFLRQRRPFVWNATSLTALREQQVSLFERYGARVRIVYLETCYAENLRRNADRPDAVPEHVFHRMLDRLEPPLPDEAAAVEWIAH